MFYFLFILNTLCWVNAPPHLDGRVHRAQGPNRTEQLTCAFLWGFEMSNKTTSYQFIQWQVQGWPPRIQVNHSDTNSSNITARALTAFSNLCNKRRGTNSSRHILCCVMDQSNAYHQRDYGSLGRCISSSKSHLNWPLEVSLWLGTPKSSILHVMSCP